MKRLVALFALVAFGCSGAAAEDVKGIGSKLKPESSDGTPSAETSKPNLKTSDKNSKEQQTVCLTEFKGCQAGEEFGESCELLVDYCSKGVVPEPGPGGSCDGEPDTNSESGVEEIFPPQNSDPSYRDKPAHRECKPRPRVPCWERIGACVGDGHSPESCKVIAVHCEPEPPPEPPRMPYPDPCRYGYEICMQEGLPPEACEPLLGKCESQPPDGSCVEEIEVCSRLGGVDNSNAPETCEVITVPCGVGQCELEYEMCLATSTPQDCESILLECQLAPAWDPCMVDFDSCIQKGNPSEVCEKTVQDCERISIDTPSVPYPD